MYENKVNMIEQLQNFSVADRKKMFEDRAREIYLDNASQAVVEAIVNYNLFCYESTSCLDVVQIVPFKYPYHPKRTLCEHGRLYGVTEFPIAIVYGDRDFMGSEGADLIIQSNAFFKQGVAQLFRLRNSGHNFVQGSPRALVELISGFCNRTIVGRFELKPLTMYAPPLKASSIPRPKL